MKYFSSLLSPRSEHLLDGFHVTMRLTLMAQLVKGMQTQLRSSTCQLTQSVLASMEKHRESVKWNLWHGNVPRTLQRIGDMQDDLAMRDENPENKRKMQKAVKEFYGYIESNTAFIPDYGDRYRHKKTISTAFVESTVNHVISKRFVKKQQMRWTQRGAHLLLQTRVQLLKGDLRKSFCRWYPKMKLDQAGSVQEMA